MMAACERAPDDGARTGPAAGKDGAARTGDGRALLEHLRHVGRAARCKEHIELFGACAALSCNRRVATRAASEVLMRCLGQALGRRPVLYRAGERNLSFDEAWLLALARSLRAQDGASATFLLQSRVPRHLRRDVLFLLHGVTEGFPQT